MMERSKNNFMILMKAACNTPVGFKLGKQINFRQNTAVGVVNLKADDAKRNYSFKLGY